MSELTDLEICKRIARIEYPLCTLEWCKDTLFVHDEIYNPLTDKALCFDLMVKHELEVFKVDSKWFCIWTGSNLTTSDKNPQRAICLAIVEPDKEQ